MLFKTYLLIGLYLLLLSNTQAATPINYIAPSLEISEKNLIQHVKFLSSNALEGRLTGSAGEKTATQYIANLFQQLGLEPAGDNGTYFQEFNFTAGVSLGKNNTLSITSSDGKTKNLKLNQEWRPLSFSDTASFNNTQIIFAGYGITAPVLGKLPAYDSYQGLDVKNKWVIVFRYTPENISEQRNHQISQYSSLRYKAFVAKEHGATGIIFVSGPNSKVKNDLIPLSSDTSLSGSGIVALSIKDSIIDELIKKTHHTLHTLQDNLDAGQSYTSFNLSHIKIIGKTDIEQHIVRGRNVLAKLRINPNASKMIIIGAHADHLGHGNLSNSRGRGNEAGMIHPGADDNASGVASMLEAAAKLSSMQIRGKLNGNKNILFAAWSGEEFGILGSSHFVSNFIKISTDKSLRPNIEAVINLDMIGHLRKKLVLQGVGSSSDWISILKNIKMPHPIPFITQNDPYLPTDSTSFYIHGVPTLNFFTGAHENYHTPRDKPETLNYNGIKNISELLVNLILTIETKSTPISYVETEKSHTKLKREFKIYLGTIPDYASSDVKGVKISGVAKNSPAQNAGIKQDDIIIELAGKSIHDIYDYTFELNGLQVGKPVKLAVLRNQKKVNLMIIARYRE
jgi:hypothetical protein